MSLRSQLTVLTVVVLVAALTVFTLLTVAQTNRELDRRGGEELAALASGLRGFAINQVERADTGRRPLQYLMLEDLQLPDSMEGYAAVIRADGTVLPLPRLAREPAQPPQLPSGLADRVGQPPFTITTPTGEPYRAQVVDVPGTDAVMVISLSEAWLRTTTDTLIRAHLVTGAALVAIFGILAAAAVTIGLRPLRAITTGAQRIADDPSGPRLPDGAPGTEIGDLSAALNAMLDGLNQAITDADQQRRRTEQFAADAAHELRTPITAITGYTDLYHRGAVADPARLDEVFARIGHEARRLRNLVEDLLTLDQLDQLDHTDPGDTAGGAATDLVAIAAATAADSMAIDPTHPITLIAPDHAPAAIDADHAFRLVANLLANIRAHTPAGTTTEITITEPCDGQVHLIVDDTGSGIPAELTDAVFDRFRRLEPHRGRTSDSGSGLGLAIVASIARNAGGHATAGAAPGGGARFDIRLPRSP